MITTTNLASFGVVFLANVVFLERYMLECPLNPSTASKVSSVNLLTARLARNEHIIRALFHVFVNNCLAKSAPLSVRRLFARLYCYGGIHNGCVIAGLFWSSVVYLLESQPAWRHPAGRWTSLTGTIFVSLMILFDLPWLKQQHHDLFEWLREVLNLAVYLVSCYRLIIQPPRNDLSQYLILALDLLLMIDPWNSFKLRSVQAEFLSSSALRLTFNEGLGSYGKTVRITNRLSIDSHQYVMFPDLKNVKSKRFSIVISNARGSPGKLISEAAFIPFKSIYVMGRPKHGLVCVTGLFRKALLVCTGASVTAALSVLAQKPDHGLTVIWSVRNPVKTFGVAICDSVRRMSDAIIIDTAAEGQRVNLGAVVFGEWNRQRAAVKIGYAQRSNMYEAVIVVSDPCTTQRVVSALEHVGIPTYGASSHS